jgi:nucleotide-binding universal stress UspA family protein
VRNGGEAHGRRAIEGGPDSGGGSSAPCGVMKKRIERILVTTDGSRESENAFGALMPLVHLDHPQVTLLYVYEGPDSSFQPPERVALAGRALRAVGVDVGLELRMGRPAEEIARLAHHVDLVAMSTHGQSGFRSRVLGSVILEVLRRVDVPVLAIRPGSTAGPWTRIMVALDGSPRGEQILEDVVPLARKFGATVDLVQVLLPAIRMAGIGEIPGIEMTEDPRPYLARVKQRVQAEGVAATTTVLEGRAASELLRHAEDSASSLLCMTTHGRTGLSRVLLGSIADEVIREASCPVLLRRSVRVEPGIEMTPLPVKPLAANA